jgi:hypothetical protein
MGNEESQFNSETEIISTVLKDGRYARVHESARRDPWKDEWERSGKTKQPYCFEVGEGELFAFAGLLGSMERRRSQVR